MSQWTLEKILAERQNLKLSWGEPWPAVKPDGSDGDAHVTLTASVDDCIALARYIHIHHAKKIPLEQLTDEMLLGDFLAVHWATVVPS
jgi:hypothetical protein